MIIEKKKHIKTKKEYKPEYSATPEKPKKPDRPYLVQKNNTKYRDDYNQSWRL